MNNPPETIEVTNCQVSGMEAPGGMMVLLFSTPFRRYAFPLDQQGRQVIANLCRGSGIIAAGVNDMPK